MNEANKKKTKLEIEKEFLGKVLESLMNEHGLIVESSFTGKSLVIKKKKDLNQTPYIEYVMDINSYKMDKIQTDLSLVDIKSYKNNNITQQEIKESGYALFEKIKQVFLYEYFDIIKENLTQEKFIQFLDRKNSKDKYNENKDTKFLINYLASNQPDYLFNYVNREQFLIEYHKLIPMLFDNHIKNFSQRKEVFNTLINTDIDKLKDQNNQNLFYKILNKYIDEKDRANYDSNFSNIKKDEVISFMEPVNTKTIKINLNATAFNSFNILNRDYTDNHTGLVLLEKGIEKLNVFNNELGFENYLFDKSSTNTCVYFTGKNPNESIIIKILDDWCHRAFSKKTFFEAIETPVYKENMLNLMLGDSLGLKEDKIPKHKI